MTSSSEEKKRKRSHKKRSHKRKKAAKALLVEALKKLMRHEFDQKGKKSSRKRLRSPSSSSSESGSSSTISPSGSPGKSSTSSSSSGSSSSEKENLRNCSRRTRERSRNNYAKYQRCEDGSRRFSDKHYQKKHSKSRRSKYAKYRRSQSDRRSIEVQTISLTDKSEDEMTAKVDTTNVTVDANKCQTTKHKSRHPENATDTACQSQHGQENPEIMNIDDEHDEENLTEFPNARNNVLERHNINVHVVMTKQFGEKKIPIEILTDNDDNNESDGKKSTYNKASDDRDGKKRAEEKAGDGQCDQKSVEEKSADEVVLGETTSKDETVSNKESSSTQSAENPSPTFDDVESQDDFQFSTEAVNGSNQVALAENIISEEVLIKEQKLSTSPTNDSSHNSVNIGDRQDVCRSNDDKDSDVVLIEENIYDTEAESEDDKSLQLQQSNVVEKKPCMESNVIHQCPVARKSYAKYNINVCKGKSKIREKHFENGDEKSLRKVDSDSEDQQGIGKKDKEQKTSVEDPSDDAIFEEEKTSPESSTFSHSTLAARKAYVPIHKLHKRYKQSRSNQESQMDKQTSQIYQLSPKSFRGNQEEFDGQRQEKEAGTEASSYNATSVVDAVWVSIAMAEIPEWYEKSQRHREFGEDEKKDSVDLSQNHLSSLKSVEAMSNESLTEKIRDEKNPSSDIDKSSPRIDESVEDSSKEDSREYKRLKRDPTNNVFVLPNPCAKRSPSVTSIVKLPHKVITVHMGEPSRRRYARKFRLVANNGEKANDVKMEETNNVPKSSGEKLEFARPIIQDPSAGMLERSSQIDANEENRESSQFEAADNSGSNITDALSQLEEPTGEQFGPPSEVLEATEESPFEKIAELDSSKTDESLPPITVNDVQEDSDVSAPKNIAVIDLEMKDIELPIIPAGEKQTGIDTCNRKEESAVRKIEEEIFEASNSDAANDSKSNEVDAVPIAMAIEIAAGVAEDKEEDVNFAEKEDEEFEDSATKKMAENDLAMTKDESPIIIVDEKGTGIKVSDREEESVQKTEVEIPEASNSYAVNKETENVTSNEIGTVSISMAIKIAVGVDEDAYTNISSERHDDGSTIEKSYLPAIQSLPVPYEAEPMNVVTSPIPFAEEEEKLINLEVSHCEEMSTLDKTDSTGENLMIQETSTKELTHDIHNHPASEDNDSSTLIDKDGTEKNISEDSDESSVESSGSSAAIAEFCESPETEKLFSSDEVCTDDAESEEEDLSIAPKKSSEKRLDIEDSQKARESMIKEDTTNEVTMAEMKIEEIDSEPLKTEPLSQMSKENSAAEGSVNEEDSTTETLSGELIPTLKKGMSFYEIISRFLGRNENTTKYDVESKLQLSETKESFSADEVLPIANSSMIDETKESDLSLKIDETDKNDSINKDESECELSRVEEYLPQSKVSIEDSSKMNETEEMDGTEQDDSTLKAEEIENEATLQVDEPINLPFENTEFPSSKVIDNLPSQGQNEKITKVDDSLPSRNAEDSDSKIDMGISNRIEKFPEDNSENLREVLSAPTTFSSDAAVEIDQIPISDKSAIVPTETSEMKNDTVTIEQDENTSNEKLNSSNEDVDASQDISMNDTAINKQNQDSSNESFNSSNENFNSSNGNSNSSNEYSNSSRKDGDHSEDIWMDEAESESDSLSIIDATDIAIASNDAMDISDNDANSSNDKSDRSAASMDFDVPSKIEESLPVELLDEQSINIEKFCNDKYLASSHSPAEDQNTKNDVQSPNLESSTARSFEVVAVTLPAGDFTEIVEKSSKEVEVPEIAHSALPEQIDASMSILREDLSVEIVLASENNESLTVGSPETEASQMDSNAPSELLASSDISVKDKPEETVEESEDRDSSIIGIDTITNVPTEKSVKIDKESMNDGEILVTDLSTPCKQVSVTSSITTEDQSTEIDAEGKDTESSTIGSFALVPTAESEKAVNAKIDEISKNMAEILVETLPEKFLEFPEKLAKSPSICETETMVKEEEKFDDIETKSVKNGLESTDAESLVAQETIGTGNFVHNDDDIPFNKNSLDEVRSSTFGQSMENEITLLKEQLLLEETLESITMDTDVLDISSEDKSQAEQLGEKNTSELLDVLPALNHSESMLLDSVEEKDENVEISHEFCSIKDSNITSQVLPIEMEITMEIPLDKISTLKNVEAKAFEVEQSLPKIVDETEKFNITSEVLPVEIPIAMETSFDGDSTAEIEESEALEVVESLAKIIDETNYTSEVLPLETPCAMDEIPHCYETQKGDEAQTSEIEQSLAKTVDQSKNTSDIFLCAIKCAQLDVEICNGRLTPESIEPATFEDQHNLAKTLDESNDTSEVLPFEAPCATEEVTDGLPTQKNDESRTIEVGQSLAKVVDEFKNTSEVQSETSCTTEEISDDRLTQKNNEFQALEFPQKSTKNIEESNGTNEISPIEASSTLDKTSDDETLKNDELDPLIPKEISPKDMETETSNLVEEASIGESNMNEVPNAEDTISNEAILTNLQPEGGVIEPTQTADLFVPMETENLESASDGKKEVTGSTNIQVTDIAGNDGRSGDGESKSPERDMESVDHASMIVQVGDPSDFANFEEIKDEYPSTSKKNMQKSDESPRQRLAESNKRAETVSPTIDTNTAAEWKKIMERGLPGTSRSDLETKHLAGSSNLPEPQPLNPVFQRLSNFEILEKKDYQYFNKLQHLRAAMMAIGKTLTTVTRQNLSTDLTKILGDVGKILAGLYHDHCIERRSSIISGLGELIGTRTDQNLIDSFLFGDPQKKDCRDSQVTERSLAENLLETITESAEALKGCNDEPKINVSSSEKLRNTRQKTEETQETKKKCCPAAEKYALLKKLSLIIFENSSMQDIEKSALDSMQIILQSDAIEKNSGESSSAVNESQITEVREKIAEKSDVTSDSNGTVTEPQKMDCEASPEIMEKPVEKIPESTFQSPEIPFRREEEKKSDEDATSDSSRTAIESQKMDCEASLETKEKLVEEQLAAMFESPDVSFCSQEGERSPSHSVEEYQGKDLERSTIESPETLISAGENERLPEDAVSGSKKLVTETQKMDCEDSNKPETDTQSLMEIWDEFADLNESTFLPATPTDLVDAERMSDNDDATRKKSLDNGSNASISPEKILEESSTTEDISEVLDDDHQSECIVMFERTAKSEKRKKLSYKNSLAVSSHSDDQNVSKGSSTESASDVEDPDECIVTFEKTVVVYGNNGEKSIRDLQVPHKTAVQKISRTAKDSESRESEKCEDPDKRESPEKSCFQTVETSSYERSSSLENLDNESQVQKSSDQRPSPICTPKVGQITWSSTSSETNNEEKTFVGFASPNSVPAVVPAEPWQEKIPQAIPKKRLSSLYIKERKISIEGSYSFNDKLPYASGRPTFATNDTQQSSQRHFEKLSQRMKSASTKSEYPPKSNLLVPKSRKSAVDLKPATLITEYTPSHLRPNPVHDSIATGAQQSSSGWFSTSKSESNDSKKISPKSSSDERQSSSSRSGASSTFVRIVSDDYKTPLSSQEMTSERLSTPETIRKHQYSKKLSQKVCEYRQSGSPRSDNSSKSLDSSPDGYYTPLSTPETSSRKSSQDSRSPPSEGDSPKTPLTLRFSEEFQTPTSQETTPGYYTPKSETQKKFQKPFRERQMEYTPVPLVPSTPPVAIKSNKNQNTDRKLQQIRARPYPSPTARPTITRSPKPAIGTKSFANWYMKNRGPGSSISELYTVRTTPPKPPNEKRKSKKRDSGSSSGSHNLSRASSAPELPHTQIGSSSTQASTSSNILQRYPFLRMIYRVMPGRSEELQGSSNVDPDAKDSTDK